MNQLSLFLFTILLFVGISHAISCDEVKSILNIEYEGSCCDLQQVNCDANENILSIETLLDEKEYGSKLYARKIHKNHSHHYNNINDNYNDTSSDSDSFVSTNINKYNVYISLVVLIVLVPFF